MFITFDSHKHEFLNIKAHTLLLVLLIHAYAQTQNCAHMLTTQISIDMNRRHAHRFLFITKPHDQEVKQTSLQQ